MRIFTTGVALQLLKKQKLKLKYLPLYTFLGLASSLPHDSRFDSREILAYCEVSRCLFQISCRLIRGLEASFKSMQGIQYSTPLFISRHLVYCIICDAFMRLRCLNSPYFPPSSFFVQLLTWFPMFWWNEFHAAFSPRIWRYVNRDKFHLSLNYQIRWLVPLVASLA